MRADRFRQTVSWPEEIYRSGLAIIVCVDSGASAFLGGQVVIDLSDLLDHLGPPETIAKMLWQWSNMADFSLRGRKAERILVSDIRLDRQNRREHRREHRP
jgi:hypothetical protein